MHFISYFPVSFSLSLTLCHLSLFSLTYVIGYMSICKSHILKINVWLKRRKHLKIWKTRSGRSWETWSWLLPNLPQKFIFPNFLLCECFPFGTTLTVSFYLLGPNVDPAGVLWFCFHFVCISVEACFTYPHCLCKI